MSEEPSDLQDTAKKYDSYSEETLNGKMGKTAQFWMTYAKIVVLIQWIKHAIKINNRLSIIHYYIHFEVTSIFFLKNHHSYVRWMSLYSLDLPNLEASQPDLQKILTEGGFQPQQNRKIICWCIPVEMAVEQRINANAKSWLKGIMASPDIYSCKSMDNDCLKEK